MARPVAALLASFAMYPFPGLSTSFQNTGQPAGNSISNFRALDVSTQHRNLDFHIIGPPRSE